jgi:DNA-binding HxlR family transcriptional regulator
MVRIDSKDCEINIKALNDALYVIGGKWKIKILVSIISGNTRFREIQRSIPKLSTKVLSSELRLLEQNRLVKRTVYDDIPVSIIYEPTDYARTLDTAIKEIIKWGKRHKNMVKEQQA